MVLTREERVMVQSSINNERVFDKLADAPRIHLRESRKRTKEEGKDGMKSNDTINIRRLQDKDKNTRNGKTWSKCLLRRLHFCRRSRSQRQQSGNCRCLIKHIRIQLTLEAVGEDALHCEDGQKYNMFSSFITLDDASIFGAAEFDAIALLADTWDNDLAPEVSAQLVRANVRAYFSFVNE